MSNFTLREPTHRAVDAAEPRPFELVLELARAENCGDAFAFQFAPQEYLLRQPDGSYRSARFPWTEQLMAELTGLSQGIESREVLQRLGDRLRSFLSQLDWSAHEAQLEQAVEAGRPIHLTFRIAAAELLALPWECVTLRSSGRCLGELPQCFVQYEWAGSRSAPATPSRPEGGRILFAWSAAGGEVPAAAHLRAIAGACGRAHHPFDERRDALAHVSLRRLVDALEASSEPIAALHILCHGTRASPGVQGLLWNASEPGGPPEVIDAGKLRQVLAPHAGRIRMVVLCACQSSAPGGLDTRLGNIALALHRAGIPAVVGSRLPISADGSVYLTEVIYGVLLERPASLQRAISSARGWLGRISHLDWATLQLFARTEDGPDFRPFVLRPYRGLLAFQPEHRRFFYGRERLQDELLRRVQDASEGRLPHFQVVAGASGTGKSSLVLAGLVPALPLDVWDVVVMRPGEGGAAAGAALGVLQRKLRHVWSGAPCTAPADSPAALVDEARRLRKARRERRLLLVVDQLEEVFTLPMPTERQAFVAALWELAHSRELRVVVVTTLRVDSFERCGELATRQGGRRLESVLYSEAYRLFVPQLQPRELRLAIIRPAQVVGLELDEGLAERIQRDLGQEPGALPLLEYALDLLWEQREGGRLTHAAYDALGGVTGALTRTADHLYDGFSAQEQAQARRLLLELVDFGGDASSNTRRRVWLQQVLPSGEEAQAAFHTVAEALVARRLLVRGGDSSEPDGTSRVWLEAAHEALIRRWERLGAWLEEDRTLVLQLREIQGWADAWQAHRADPDGGQSYLLVGNRLGYARRVQEEHAAKLSRESHQFIDRSLQAARAADATERQRQRVLRAALRRAQDFARQLAARDIGRDDPTTGALVLRESRDPGESFAWKATALELLQQPIARAILRGHEGLIRSIAFSPDGTRVVTASYDRTARIWRADGSGQPIVLAGHSGFVHAATFSPDGTRVLTASDDGTARIWRADGVGQPIVFEGRSDWIHVAAFSPDGTRIVTASVDGVARVWQVNRSAKSVALHGHTEWIHAAAFSPDGTRIVTASSDCTVRLWRADGTEPPLVLRGHSRSVHTACFSTDGTRILTASSDGTARIWRVGNSEAIAVLKGHADWVLSAAFSPDGTRVVTSSSDGTARIWRADGTGEPMVLQGHADWVLTAAFSPDGTRVVTTSADGTARVWNALRPAEPLILKGHSGSVNAAAFHPDGARVVTASDDGTSRVWSLAGPVEPTVLKGHSDGIRACAFSPDGAHAFTASSDGTARVWRLDGSAVPCVLAGHAGPVKSAAFSPDSARIATASEDGTARVWCTDRSTEPLLLRGHAGPINAIAFAPDGKRVLTASDDKTGRIWCAEGFAVPLVLSGSTGPVRAAAFSPDGVRVVLGSDDCTARVWRADRCDAAPFVLAGHTGPVRAVCFNPDGTRVATASDDGTARVWRADGSATALKGHSAPVRVVCFSFDGTRIVTGSDDGTARVWRVDGSAAPLVLKGHSGWVRAACFSREGAWVLTASTDGTARLWRTDGSAAPLVLKGHSGPVHAAAFSPHGTRILTASNDGTARLWRLSTDALLERLDEATSASLTRQQREHYLGESVEEARLSLPASFIDEGRVHPPGLAASRRAQRRITSQFLRRPALRFAPWPRPSTPRNHR